MRARSRWVLVGAAVVVLAIGVGVGWLLFGRNSGPAIAITAEQQVRGAQLEAEAKYDPGSMIPLAEDEGIVVWVATRDSGELTCVVIDDGDVSQSGCAPDEMVDSGGVSTSLGLTDPGEASGETFQATVFRDGAGDPVAVIQRWPMTFEDTFLDQFTVESERATAEHLVGDGFDDWSPAIVGYDEGTPIWFATRDTGNESCIFYGGDADAPSACAPYEDAQNDSRAISIQVPAGPDSYRDVVLRYTAQGSPYLIITDRATNDDAEGAQEHTFDDLAGDRDG